MKNFEKYRPIASYYLHPLKRVYKVAGQGLVVILKTIETSHMNIFSTYDTKSKIETIFNEINSFEKQHNCHQANIQTYAGNIKQLSFFFYFDINVLTWSNSGTGPGSLKSQTT